MKLVSACLAGCNCRYNGKNNTIEEIMEMVENSEAVTVCPEVLGGLPIPRNPSEMQIINGERYIISNIGEDVTEQFFKGAKKTLEIVREIKPTEIILKSKSPSCGVGKIYDGSFSGKLIDGNGITAQMLIDEGYDLTSEEKYIKN